MEMDVDTDKHTESSASASQKERKDGRIPLQLRMIDAEQGNSLTSASPHCHLRLCTCCLLRPDEIKGPLNRADGSAKFTQGETSVLVSVYGPMEPPHRKELIDRANIDVTFRPKTGIPGIAEKEKEYYLRNSIENVVMYSLHPRTQISITVQVLNDDGSLLATCINAVCVALLDAGIPMKAQIASVACALSKDGILLLDPSFKEEQESKAVFTFAVNSTFDGMVTSKTMGVFTEDDYFNAFEACKQASSKVFAFFRSSLEKKLNKK